MVVVFCFVLFLKKILFETYYWFPNKMQKKLNIIKTRATVIHRTTRVYQGEMTKLPISAAWLYPQWYLLQKANCNHERVCGECSLSGWVTDGARLPMTNTDNFFLFILWVQHIPRSRKPLCLGKLLCCTEKQFFCRPLSSWCVLSAPL